MMTIEEDIAFWERAAMTAERRGSALVYAGIAAGLKMARNDHMPAPRPPASDDGGKDAQ